MKKLFFGLLVAGVAISASAFTNAHRPTFIDTVYVTDKVEDDGVEYYEYQTSSSGITCSSGSDPCQVTTRTGYTLPASRFPVSDYNNTNFNTSLTVTQPAL